MFEKPECYFNCIDMEDTNISEQKFSVSTDINVSEKSLEFSDALFFKF